MWLSCVERLDDMVVDFGLWMVVCVDWYVVVWEVVCLYGGGGVVVVECDVYGDFCLFYYMLVVFFVVFGVVVIVMCDLYVVEL